MAIRMKCAHCRRAVAVTRRAAGTQVPCPACRQPLDVPAIATEICLRQPTLAPAAPIVAEAPLEMPQAAPAINYRILGTTIAAAVGGLAVLAVLATVVSRRPSHREWAASEASGRATPAMWLAHLNRPLFDEPAAESATEYELQTVAAPAADEMEYQAPAPLVIDRRDRMEDEDLRKQLLKVPELDLYRLARRTNSVDGKVIRMSFSAYNAQLRDRPLHEVIDIVANRKDLAGLPMRPAPDCQLGKEPAEHLQKVSTDIRTKMGQTLLKRGDLTETVGELLREQRRFITIGDKTREMDFRESSIPAVMQMLCVENSGIRQLMTEHLGDNDSKTASRALAKMAIFDLSSKVRANALKALADRPRGEYRQVLLDGLRYPWAPVADHAAEALVGLEDTDALPSLKDLAKLPDPSAPIYDAEHKKHFVREVVRINHLGNCMLCHAPSKAPTDLVRGRIATPGEVLPPLVQYYQQQDGIFVRADITYLRQDFSVIQPVDNSGAWPSQQRFDYLVRNRPVDVEEAQELSRLTSSHYPQRDAVLHVIARLSSMPAKPRLNDELTLQMTRR